MSEADLAEEICEELGLDYNRVFAELEVKVSTAFLEAVHEEIVENEDETRDVGEAVDYEEAYDGPLDLISGMKAQVRGTDLNSVGWSIFESEFLQDLDALEEMIEERDSQ
ncbi:hypothetical protein [Haloferax sp. Q22]|uniref:hypothetical protein n=1 Tax=Haloferax sp. (strain Q22) TaxID=1526048 RepID=UPI000737C055|nr:hypothetical protein [Haloferax sp. Q22]